MKQNKINDLLIEAVGKLKVASARARNNKISTVLWNKAEEIKLILQNNGVRRK